jgi:para-nitrobenzyl esterase
MAPRARTEQGVVEGTADDSVFCFLGLPFARPPVGNLRWQAPLPPEPWDGVRAAARFGPACHQVARGSADLRVQERSEDCLYLNVWTSELGAAARQPVMVWIHGGGFMTGAGSEDAIDGARLAAAQGVVVVTLNYRLGVFGFALHPEIQANAAVLDHVAALNWVAQNIEAFGGDPGNVTAFGESAGAVAVRTLLSVGRARGLFHRAIIQSAGFEPPAFGPATAGTQAEKLTMALIDRFGGGDVDVLRRMPAPEITALAMKLREPPPPGQVHTPAGLAWVPTRDGDVVAPDGYPGWPADVPVMLCTVENEARYFVKPSEEYPRRVVEEMARLFGRDRAGAALDLLDRTDLTDYEKLDRLFTTAIWHEPALATLGHFAELGRRQYYVHFDRVSPGRRKSGELALHTGEIRYVFGNLDPAEDYDDVDATVSAAMQAGWAAFARTGAPAGPDADPWPEFDAGRPEITHIGDTIERRPFAPTDLSRILHGLRAG